MPKYSKDELDKRGNIIRTHKNFDKFLDIDIINTLVNLFDETVVNEYSNQNEKMTKYVENERKARDLSNSNVSFKSYICEKPKKNDNLKKRKNDVILKRDSNLVIVILKDNKEFLHLTIHLSLKYLAPELTGMIHFYKDVYETNINQKDQKSLIYALISVQKPNGKPNSLEFSIADGYTSPSIIKDRNIYDPELQKEMDVIICVLNRLFDETNEDFYVGNKKNLSFIHNKTDKVLELMNKYTKHITRKNIETKLFPFSSNQSVFETNLKKNNTGRRITRKKNNRSKRTTRRKIHKKIGSK